MTEHYYLAWTAYFVGNDRRFWSGKDPLTFGGHTWEAGKGIDVQGLIEELGSSSQQTQITLAVEEDSDLALFLQDIGVDEVQIELLWSNDHGGTWQATGARSVTEVNNQSFENGLFSVETRTYIGRSEFDVPKLSHEEQMARGSGGVDRAFEMTKLIEGSSALEISWPQR